MRNIFRRFKRDDAAVAANRRTETLSFFRSDCDSPQRRLHARTLPKEKAELRGGEKDKEESSGAQKQDLARLFVCPAI